MLATLAERSKRVMNNNKTSGYESESLEKRLDKAIRERKVILTGWFTHAN